MSKIKLVLTVLVLSVLAACTGAQGPVGPIGPMGPQGPKGDVGPQGEQGPAGPQVVAGAVNRDGAIVGGTGFTVKKIGPLHGDYIINFTPAFTGEIFLTATTGLEPYASAGFATSQCTSTSTPNSCVVMTYSFNGSGADQSFMFIATGPR